MQSAIPVNTRSHRPRPGMQPARSRSPRSGVRLARLSLRAALLALALGWVVYAAGTRTILCAGRIGGMGPFAPPAEAAEDVSRRAADPELADAAEEAKESLLAVYGEEEHDRIDRGTAQVLRYWQPPDGGPETLREFLEEEFIGRGEKLDATFARFEFALERLGGYLGSLSRDLSRGMDLDIGPILPLYERLAAYKPYAHVTDDLFQTKIAFVALLNFPLTTLGERNERGLQWSRRQWAETRLAQRFSERVPAEVRQEITRAFVEADTYINAYNIYMHHLLTEDGRRLFPEGLRLISHWNLRDELKAAYADPAGLEKQRMIQLVMERIVRQEIPAAVVNNPLLDWTPATNAVSASPVRDARPPEGASEDPSFAREPDERYGKWLGIFHALRLSDPYCPDNPTHIDRSFNVRREIPEDQVRALFEDLLTSSVGVEVAELIEERLGRPLEPFDIWYAGFRPRAQYEERELDAVTRERYPTTEDFTADLPRILTTLGFSREQARFLADHIVVDPSRGPGHASGPARRDDQAHLRTRVGEQGMDYKGYNIAIHELGHNCEQVFSMITIDHTLLEGVPNTACTEAMAFIFQNRDLELLGLGDTDPAARDLAALASFWATREIAGVGLVDMNAWEWLYDNPEASPAQFREAVISIAQDVWNRYYARIFGARDVELLAVYSHMVDEAMYTPDYGLGHLIAFQIEEHFEGREDFGAEFERINQLGRISPDAWMRRGVGAPISAGPLLRAAQEGLARLKD